MHATFSRSARTRFKKLKVINDNFQFGALLVILTRPLVKPEMSFDKELLALAKILLDQVGQLTARLPVKGFHIDKNWVILPLARAGVLAAVVDREAKGGHLASGGKRSHLGVAGQTPD
jgi:hypothetical protein